MSAKQIPEYIDPFRYAEQALQLSGVVNLADMNRLQPMINPSKEWVVVELYFGIDEQGLTFLQGHLQARLGLQCQRCMEPYNYEIITDFVLGIVNTDDEAKDLQILSFIVSINNTQDEVCYYFIIIGFHTTLAL